MGDPGFSVLIRLADLWSSTGVVLAGGVLGALGVVTLLDLLLLPVIVKSKVRLIVICNLNVRRLLVGLLKNTG